MIGTRCLISSALPQTKPDMSLKEPLSGPPGARPAVNAQRPNQATLRHPLRLVATRRSTSPGFAEGGKTFATTSRLPPSVAKRLGEVDRAFFTRETEGEAPRAGRVRAPKSA